MHKDEGKIGIFIKTSYTAVKYKIILVMVVKKIVFQMFNRVLIRMKGIIILECKIRIIIMNFIGSSNIYRKNKLNPKYT